jgi:hypothetical protein
MAGYIETGRNRPACAERSPAARSFVSRGVAAADTQARSSNQM